MKKTEAISILATSVRPREAKDRARYDKAVKMAIEALKCSEIPNSSDSISRQAAIDIAVFECGEWVGLAKEISKQLKQLPSAQPEILACGEGELNVPDTNVGDMISRQAAIDALDVLCQEHRYKIPGKRETYSQYNEAWQDALDRAEGAIFNLPTVQPDHTADVSKKVKRTDETAQNVSDSDLVSRKAAIEAIAKQMPRSYTPDGSHPADEEIYKAQEIYVDCIESIEILPAVQPEIIRCKDCKYWRDDHTCHEHSLVSPMCANEYCSRAERRTDE